jgi:hypothetical protein
VAHVLPRDEGQLGDSARVVGAAIQDGFPGAILESFEMTVSVPVQVLHVGKVPWFGGAAMKQRELMAAARGELDECAPDELRPADDQDLHPHLRPRTPAPYR